MATLTSPSPGSTLSGTAITFQLEYESGDYYLYLKIGTAYGGSDLYSSVVGGSVYVSGLPQDGSTLYVSVLGLDSQMQMVNSHNYTVIAYSPTIQAVCGSTLSLSTSSYRVVTARATITDGISMSGPNSSNIESFLSAMQSLGFDGSALTNSIFSTGALDGMGLSTGSLTRIDRAGLASQSLSFAEELIRVMTTVSTASQSMRFSSLTVGEEFNSNLVYANSQLWVSGAADNNASMGSVSTSSIQFSSVATLAAHYLVGAADEINFSSSGNASILFDLSASSGLQINSVVSAISTIRAFLSDSMLVSTSSIQRGKTPNGNVTISFSMESPSCDISASVPNASISIKKTKIIFNIGNAE